MEENKFDFASCLGFQEMGSAGAEGPSLLAAGIFLSCKDFFN